MSNFRMGSSLAVPAILFLMTVTNAAAQDYGPQVDINDFGTIIFASKWETKIIPVCWENASDENGALRLTTRRAVEETWQRYADLDFIGWGPCQDNSKGIHIQISDEGAHTKSIGKYLDSMPSGMVLNFSFKNWSKPCRANIDFCVYAIAAHEFGHAIGFTHEHNRDDRPPECRREPQGSTGDYKVTQYDPFSIMNYCNPTWNGDGRLSELDVASVQTIYGTRH